MKFSLCASLGAAVVEFVGLALLQATIAQSLQLNTTDRPWVYPYGDFDGQFSVTGDGQELEEKEEERAARPFQSSEFRLMHHLVRDYDNSVRPVFDANDAVDIRLGLTLTQILDLDEKNQVLTTNVWLEAEWYDQRLNWSSSDFGGVTSIRIPCHKLWLPDIVLYNSVDDYTSGYMPSLVMVYNSSRVFWGPVIRFRSSCQIDITFFPFDTQVCKLKMGSWAYTGLQVNVWNSSHTMDLSNLVDNGEWELLGVAVKRNVVFYNCCKEPFPDVTFSIQLRRRTKYYFMNIIIPCIILSFLCLGGFLLPPESGEKITLGLSVLLTITVFMLMVADKMPQTSESISVISIYLMVVLATSCMSVLSSVLVLSIHHQRGRPSRAPLWLRRLCFSMVAKLLHLTQVRDTYAAEFQKTRPTLEPAQINASTAFDRTSGCCYGNCATTDPGSDSGGRRDTRYGTGRCKIANSSADGYIEMRQQFRHNAAGNDVNEGQKNFGKEYHEVVFSPGRHQRQKRCSVHAAGGDCSCLTSHVYLPQQQDVSSCKRSPSSSFTGRRHTTFSSCGQNATYSPLRCVQQENISCSSARRAKQSSLGLPTVNSARQKSDCGSTCFNCGNALGGVESKKTRAACCFQGPIVDSVANHSCKSGKGEEAYRKVSDMERGGEQFAERGEMMENQEELNQSDSSSEEDEYRSDPFKAPPQSQSDNAVYRNRQQNVSSTGGEVVQQSQASDIVHATPNSIPKQPAGSATYRAILRYLLSLIQIRQEQEVTEVKDDELFREWHDVAFVLDRLLFYLFFLVTFVSTVGILEMRPDTEPL